MDQNDYSAGCAYIEGDFVPIGEAWIPIMDMGFMRSDVTYDVVAAWEGGFFRLDDHMARFQRSWEQLYMSPPLSPDEMRAVLTECVRRSGIRNAYVAMIVTRGIAPKGTRDPREFNNRFYAFAVPYMWICHPDQHDEGLHLIVVEQTIRIPSNAVDPTVKNFHWGDLIRSLFEAYDRGGQNAVLCDAEGNVTEGPGFNLFALKDGELYTPKKGTLFGITRQTALELAQEMGIQTHETTFKADLLFAAEELFLTSTAGGIIPITKLNEQVIGNGRMGPTTHQLYDRYWAEHKNGRWVTQIDYEQGGNDAALPG
ncbi:MAG: aminotransferase class IV [Chloroflexota bacterium]